jgi:hypothetical protein
MEAALRTQISEARRTTHDGRIWPVERHRMQSAETIRERMIEDIAKLARVDGEFASLSLDDLTRQGWTPDQVRHHGTTAFNLFRARCDAAETVSDARQMRTRRDRPARMVADAAAILFFAGSVGLWAGHFTGAL